jgi:16S rRNA (adenine1518-N6/adenine1519-N6)-dimethyltransferase
MKHIPRKRFGQHFLTDHGIIDEIVRAIAPRAGQHVVEIGPGLAALTQPLAERLGHLTVIELDRDLARQLRTHPQLSVVEADVLKVDFRALAVSISHAANAATSSSSASATDEAVPGRERSVPPGGSEPHEVGSAGAASFQAGAAGLALPDRRRSAPSGGSAAREAASVGASKLRVVGNLPYNISTPILFHLLDAVDVIEDQHFMLQKEVVDRMVAQPSTSAYGRLSVMLQWRYAMENVLLVPPQSFDPPPRVDSAIVRMVPLAAPAPIETRRLSELVQVAFSQRRKLLRHTLGAWLASQDFKGDFDVQRRAEEVPVAEYLALAGKLSAGNARGAPARGSVEDE